MYPGAKVVLTVREARGWQRSAHMFYDQMNSLAMVQPYR